MSMGYDTDLLEFMDAVMKSLPHGSGIDYTWHVCHILYTEKGGELDISFTNEYHAMDENGMYCCGIPFLAHFTCTPLADGFTITDWYVCVDILLEDEDFKHVEEEHYGIEDYLQQEVEFHLIEGLKALGYKFKRR